MITDLNRQTVYATLNRNNLPEYWNGYFLYQQDAPELHVLTDRGLRSEVEACKNTSSPYVDGQVVVGMLLRILSGQHNFHRQFSERFENLHREQILGMQLYTIMLADNETWVYTTTQHADHLYAHAVYFLPNSVDNGTQ